MLCASKRYLSYPRLDKPNHSEHRHQQSTIQRLTLGDCGANIMNTLQSQSTPDTASYMHGPSHGQLTCHCLLCHCQGRCQHQQDKDSGQGHLSDTAEPMPVLLT